MLKPKPLAQGAQGAVFAHTGLGPSDIVCKVFSNPRPRSDVFRMQRLITLCRNKLDSNIPAHQVLLSRVNLPLRPVVDSQERLAGLYLPVIPEACYWQGGERFGKFAFEGKHFFGGIIRLSTADRWMLMYRLVETMTVLHAGGLIHGDLSMDNVLGSKEGDALGVYLIDFTDGFMDDGHRSIIEVRRNYKFYDPFSVRDGRISTATDIFVTCWWLACLAMGEVRPPSISGGLPTPARGALAKVDRDLSALVAQALGEPGKRPDMRTIYSAIHHASCKETFPT